MDDKYLGISASDEKGAQGKVVENDLGSLGVPLISTFCDL